jgi:hypothetical protein
MKISKSWLVALALIGSAEAWRLWNWNAGFVPGLELVTASTLVAAALLPRRAALVVPLGIMAAGDLVIGNEPILLFTWSAFAFIGLVALNLRRLKLSRLRMIAVGTGAGVLASVFFFLFTNFGVWLLGDGTMYAKTWSGLLECYYMGLPFYRTNVLGNLAIVPLYLTVGLYGPVWLKRLSRRTAAQPVLPAGRIAA